MASSFRGFTAPPLSRGSPSSRPTSAASAASAAGRRRRQQRGQPPSGGRARPQSAAADHITHSSQETPTQRRRRRGKSQADKYAYNYWGSYSHPHGGGKKKTKPVMYSTLKRKKKRALGSLGPDASESCDSPDSTSSAKVFNKDTQYWLKHTDVLLEQTIGETKRLAALERQIKTVERAIREYRLRLGGVMAVKENDKHARQTISRSIFTHWG